MKGYESHEIIGRHFSAFYPPEALSRRLPDHALRWRACTDASPTRAGGSGRMAPVFWASVLIAALRPSDRSGAGYLKITRDLTERRETEETCAGARSDSDS
jgi:PAS domain S-box-containing protein